MRQQQIIDKTQTFCTEGTDMKKTYDNLEMETIFFAAEDIIVTSNNGHPEDNGEGENPGRP